MKYLGYLLLAVLMCNNTELSAQNRKTDKKKQEPRMEIIPDSICGAKDKQRNEQMKAQRVGYFTTMLELTAKEAQEFWVIYNEFSDKRDALHCERRDIMRKIRREKVDDKVAQELINKILQNAEAILQLQKEYNPKLAAVLSPQKMLKYFAAEESFKAELLNKLRTNHHGGNAPFNKPME